MRDIGGLRIQTIDRILLSCSFRLQIINSCRVCRRLLHGIIDISQCGDHARAIADSPSHLQRTCFHGSHAVQRRTVRRELRGFVLQSGDVAFIRGDFRFGCIQITLICFISKRVIQSIPLILQLIYFSHQSVGIITNRSFKSCYFPLYAPYASFQCCNRSRVRFICQFTCHRCLDY